MRVHLVVVETLNPELWNPEPCPLHAAGKWRNLDVAVKTVLFSERHGGMHGSKAGTPQQRAVMEAAVCTSVVHPNVVST